MKKIVCLQLVLVLWCSASIWATNETSSSSSRYETVNLVFNYSDALIAGLSYDDFVSTQNEEDQNWTSVESEWRRKFLENANEKVQYDKLRLGSFKNAKYSLVVVFSELNKKGNISCVCYYVDQQGNKVSEEKSFYASGGHIGSVVNLIGDGQEELGSKIGRKISFGFYPKSEDDNSVSAISEEDEALMAEKAVLDENKYYIMLLLKSNNFDEEKIDKASKYFDIETLKQQKKQYSFKDLKQLSIGHDKIFEKFVKYPD